VGFVFVSRFIFLYMGVRSVHYAVGYLMNVVFVARVYIVLRSEEL